MSSWEGLFNLMHREIQRGISRMMKRRSAGIVDAYDPETHSAKWKLMPHHSEPVVTGWLPLPMNQTGNKFGHYMPPNIGDHGWIEYHADDNEAGIAVHFVANDKMKPKGNLKAGENYYEHKSGSSVYHEDKGSVEIQDKGGAKIVIDGKSNVTIGPKDGEKHRVATMNGLSANVFAIMSNGGGNDNVGAEGGTKGGQGGDPLPVIGGGSGKKQFPPGILTADQQNPFNTIGGMFGGMLAIGQQDSQGNQTVPQAMPLKQDGQLAADGTLFVPSTGGVPFVPSATIDTTNAQNIFNVYGVLLSTTVIKPGDATVTDTTSFGNAYNEFEIVLDGILTTSAAVTLELQVQSGGVFQTTGYNSIFTLASVTGTSTTFVFVAATNDMPNTVPGLSGSIRIRRPFLTNTPKMVTGTVGYNNNAGVPRAMSLMGYWGSNGALTGFRILPATGTLAAGTVRVLGLYPIGAIRSKPIHVPIAQAVSVVPNFIAAGSLPVTPSTTRFRPGQYIYAVPQYNTLTVTLLGPSGGGGPCGAPNEQPGTDGKPDTSFGSSTPVIAGGGKAGGQGEVTQFSQKSAPDGTPGTASGGDTNTVGGGPAGGVGGIYKNAHGGTGGAGGKAVKTWRAGDPGAPVAGGTILVTVGSHGLGGIAGTTGAAGGIGADGSAIVDIA